MSVATAPLISLEQARELVQLLEFGRPRLQMNWCSSWLYRAPLSCLPRLEN